jgi:predicted dehydrogenase
MIANLTLSFDVLKSSAPSIEIYGSKATMRISNPNLYFGSVELWAPPPSGPPKAGQWREIFRSESDGAPSRGIGLLQMLDSIDAGTPHQADGERALHAVRVLAALLKSAELQTFVAV